MSVLLCIGEEYHVSCMQTSKNVKEYKWLASCHSFSAHSNSDSFQQHTLFPLDNSNNTKDPCSCFSSFLPVGCVTAGWKNSEAQFPNSVQ